MSVEAELARIAITFKEMNVILGDRITGHYRRLSNDIIDSFCKRVWNRAERWDGQGDFRYLDLSRLEDAKLDRMRGGAGQDALPVW